MFNPEFIKATLERAVKTFAQTLGALLVADGTGLLNSDWVELLSISGMAALLSLLASIASAQISREGPSLIGVEHLTGSLHRQRRSQSQIGAGL